MLRKFLQILKGNTQTPDFEGSYLDFLLDQAHDEATAALRACPEHDPLLTLAIEVLRGTNLELTAQLSGEPLVDAHSPVLKPAALDEPEEDAALKPEEPAGALEDEGDQEEEALEGEPEDNEAEDRAEDAQESAPTEAQGEERSNELAEGDEALAKDMRQRERKLLQAARVFMGLLIENDRLPLEMQLTPPELMLSRDLLLGYFIHDEQIESRAQELLELVEQKFNAAAFSQARILLRLFQSDRATRVNNDRNLFYEEMILRMGVRRRHKIRPAMVESFQAQVRAAKEQASAQDELVALSAELGSAASWLDESLHITLHLFTREGAQVKRWRAFAQQSSRLHADDFMLRFIPPKRWRPVAAEVDAQKLDEHGRPAERLLAHISAATVKKYIVRQFKTAYFVLRAVGDTGLEPFLEVFFEWTERKFDLNAVQLMPLAYRRTMSDAYLVDQIFEQLFELHFKPRAAEYLAEFDDAAILAAAAEALEELMAYDYNQIAPGDYDLGGFIFDRLFEIEYHEPEFGFRLHRLA